MKIIKSRIGIFLIILFMIILIPQIFALSNESLEAKQLIEQAKQDIAEMQLRNIPVARVNESYQEALQLYYAQSSLEKLRKKADYKLVIQYASNVNTIKESALQADDELKIFKETYKQAAKEINLSEMDNEYNAIMFSFQEERFEDTIKLIDKGYEKLSEVQASQTTLRLFYATTSRTIKNFFINNWLKMLIIITTVLFFLIVFWKTLSKSKLMIKLNNFTLQKKSINKLIKQMQFNYFKKKNLSKLEYNIKSNAFEEMIRELDRKVMILRTNIFKLRKKNKKKTK